MFSIYLSSALQDYYSFTNFFIYRCQENNPRTTEIVSWAEEVISHGVRDGCSLRLASLKFNISYRSFKEQMEKGKNNKYRVRNATIFSKKQEKNIC